MLTSGEDGTLRSWTQDSFDQKFQFMKLNENCELSIYNKSDAICCALYENSYIRVYNMSTLKSIGQITIPDNDINCFNYIFNQQGLFVSTLQDKLFVVYVQNWDPLSILFTEINGDFLPTNQMSKFIDSKNLSNLKSLVALSFSDGTVCIIQVEKNNTKIDYAVLDKFNIFEYHITKSDDVHTAELFKNLTKFRVKL
jgi:hypothetical protein